MMTEPHIFEPLPLRRREVVAISQDEYSIMSQSGEVKEVKANTAYEAFKLSGLSDAIKIERKAMMKASVLTKNRFVEGTGTRETSVKSASAIAFRQQRPVVSADDLDALMRMLQATQAESANVPAPQEQIPQVITNPTGMEVHGDGFDEIIPATVSPSQMTGIKSSADTVVLADDLPQQPSQPAAAPAQPAAAPVQAAATQAPAEAAPQATAEAAPEKELTQDEITKLLNG